MKKTILSSLLMMVALSVLAATPTTWTNVVTVKLIDGNNDNYTSRFGEATELTDQPSWGAAVANLEGATVRAYTVLNGVNYEKLYLQDMTNTALVVKTYESTSLSFELKANYGIVTLFDKLTGATKTVDKAGVAGLVTDTYNCTVEANATIENRFILFYSAPTVQLFNEWDDNWATPLNFTNNNDGTFSATKTFTGNGYCPFKIVENSNWLGNGDAFKRDYTSATGIGDGANMTLWVDVPGDYTFTWDFMANALSITMPALPTVQMKGSWDTWGDFVDFTPATDGLTASAVLNLDPADWYQFKVALNGTDWRSFEYVDDATSPFTRTNNSHNWINADHTDNMSINADQAGDYTFTWTYVENKLTITFPAPVPTTSVTTNAYGFCSFASSENVEFLGGLKAYKGDFDPATYELTLTEVGTKVPANTGVILWNSAETAGTFYYNVGVDASAADVTGNDFVGAVDATPVAGISADAIYCLHGNELMKYVGTEDIPAGKAYLPVTVSGSNPAPKHIVMRFNNTTAVDNVEAGAEAVKFVEDGQILIRRGNEVYNLQGQIVK